MIRVFNKGVKGRGGGPWSSIFKEGEGVKGIPPYISVYYYKNKIVNIGSRQ